MRSITARRSYPHASPTPPTIDAVVDIDPLSIGCLGDGQTASKLSGRGFFPVSSGPTCGGASWIAAVGEASPRDRVSRPRRTVPGRSTLGYGNSGARRPFLKSLLVIAPRASRDSCGPGRGTTVRQPRSCENGAVARKPSFRCCAKTQFLSLRDRRGRRGPASTLLYDPERIDDPVDWLRQPLGNVVVGNCSAAY